MLTTHVRTHTCSIYVTFNKLNTTQIINALELNNCNSKFKSTPSRDLNLSIAVKVYTSALKDPYLEQRYNRIVQCINSPLDFYPTRNVLKDLQPASQQPETFYLKEHHLN